VQRGQLLDDVPAAALDVRIPRTGEPAARGFQVLEHHHIALAVGAGVVRARNTHRHFRRQVTVEARLRDAHAHGGDELALPRVERRQFDENGCRQRGVTAEPETRPAGGAGMLVDELGGSHVTLQRLGKESRRQLGDFLRDHAGML